MHIYNLSATIAIFFGLIVSLLSLWLCLRPSSPRYMRSFPIYCWANSIMNFGLIPALRNHEGAIIFTAFETCYFAFFITCVIHWKWMIGATWTMVALYLIFIIYKGISKIEGTLVTPALLESCILIIPFLYYYWELLKRSEVLKLKKEAAVWIVCGALVYFVVVIPTLSFCTYYHYLLENNKSYGVFSIINFVQLASYSLFIKGMSCKRRTSSSLSLS
jgi:hypothetical protein